MPEITRQVPRASRAAIKRTPRPRDRKAQIVGAARQLFARKGYAAVSAEEIASAVGITAGALYRHFGGKQDLLVHALIDALDAASLAVQQQSATELDGVLDALADVAGSNREIGVLWTREIRLLDADKRAVVREHFFAVFEVVRERIAVSRPDLEPAEAELLTWSVFAVLTSVSYHRVPITPAVMGVLRAATTSVCSADLVVGDDAEKAGDAPRLLLPRSRREQIMISAAEQFHKHSYASTSMADIGETTGLTAAGVYRYFSTKAEILSALLLRAMAAFQLQVGDAFARSDDEEEALARLVDTHIALALRHPALVGILLTEARELPADVRETIRRGQEEYLTEWEHLLRVCAPALGRSEARVLVVAVITVINDATRTARLRSRAALSENLPRICRLMLHMDPGPQLS